MFKIKSTDEGDGGTFVEVTFFLLSLHVGFDHNGEIFVMVVPGNTKQDGESGMFPGVFDNADVTGMVGDTRHRHSTSGTEKNTETHLFFFLVDVRTNTKTKQT